MLFPITRYQLVAAIETFGFRTNEAERIVTDLDGEGRIVLTASMLQVRNPTDPDAPVLAGLCREARGGSAGSVGTYKIKEYLQAVHQRAGTHGFSYRM
ncbi:MAG: hypothetical protein ACE5I3_08355 [Phycisphaerae bacterium]